MTVENTIRRYILISEEVRFLNSNKQFVIINIENNDIKMSLSNKQRKNSYTRTEFKKILDSNFEWIKEKIMTIKKKLHDDKKEKHNSIELTIYVPSMPVPKCMAEVGGYSTNEITEYHSHHASFDEAESVFKEFMRFASGYYNKHKDDFHVEDISDENS